MNAAFRKATKQTARLRLALCGPSGSGKTYSALRLATGLGGPVALIDTERGSASLYADRFNFDVLEISPPYQPSKYTDAIGQAQGYGVLVIDSLSHAWAGEGGILETVDELQARGQNKFTAWGPATKAQNAMINRILECPCHVIATMRSKQDYALEVNGRGKQVPVKLGMAPVQRDGVEYEFAIVLEINMANEAGVGMAGKDRTGLYAGQVPRVLTEDDGKLLGRWLATNGHTLPDPLDLTPEANSLSPAEQQAAREAHPQEPVSPPSSPQQQETLVEASKALGLTFQECNELLRGRGVPRVNKMTVADVETAELLFHRHAVEKLLTRNGLNLDDVRSRNPNVTADVPGEMDLGQCVIALRVLRDWEAEAVPV